MNNVDHQELLSYSLISLFHAIVFRLNIPNRCEFTIFFLLPKLLYYVPCNCWKWTENERACKTLNNSLLHLNGLEKTKISSQLRFFHFSMLVYGDGLVNIEQTLYVTDFVIYAAKNVYGQWKSWKKSQWTFT